MHHLSSGVSASITTRQGLSEVIAPRSKNSKRSAGSSQTATGAAATKRTPVAATPKMKVRAAAQRAQLSLLALRLGSFGISSVKANLV